MLWEQPWKRQKEKKKKKKKEKKRRYVTKTMGLVLGITCKTPKRNPNEGIEYTGRYMSSEERFGPRVAIQIWKL